MRKLIQYLKNRAKKLKLEIITLYYAYKNSKTPILAKMIVLITLAYALSPIDLIPDFIPILGYLDDLIILPALIALSIKLIPKEILVVSREKAIEEPLKLKKNWFSGIVFILIWIGLIILVVLKIFVFLNN